MAVFDDVISELNNFLVTDNFDIEKFDKLYQTIKLNDSIKIKFIDFERYNEEKLTEAKKEKLNCLTLQNFEKASIYRDFQFECQKYVDLKTEFKIEKSTFYYEQNYLMYFYFGTAKNDKLVSEHIKKGTP